MSDLIGMKNVGTSAVGSPQPVLNRHDTAASIEESESLLRDAAIAKIEAARKHHLEGKTLLSSRDPDVIAAVRELEDAFPSEFAGVKRWFLPFVPVMPRGSGRYAAYISRLEPRAVVSRSVQQQNYELKIVISGAIHHEGRTLTAGDWLWVPEGGKYVYTAGDFGAVVLTQWPYTELTDISVMLGTALGSVSTSSRDPRIDAHARATRGSLSEHAEGDHQFIPFAPTMPQTQSEGRFFQWLSRIDPNTTIPGHSHPLEKLGDMKVVISGSVMFQGRELTAGDWFWAPSGEQYTFSTGDRGAILMSGWPWN